jgi:hypothetical protein
MSEYHNNVEKITKQAKALGVEFLRQYRAEFLRQDSVDTALEIAHEKARQYLENSLPVRPGAF